LTIQRNQQYGWHKTKKKKKPNKNTKIYMFWKQTQIPQARHESSHKTWVLPQDMSPPTNNWTQRRIKALFSLLNWTH
jgi:hypothetical protein